MKWSSKQRVKGKITRGENIERANIFENSESPSTDYTEDVYDYEDYVLNQQLEDHKVLPEEFLNLRFSELRHFVLPRHRTVQGNMRSSGDYGAPYVGSPR